MKKIILASALFTAMVIVFTGCLKDKGFDNHQYGINDPDSQPPGVGFALGATTKVGYGLDVTTSTQSVNGIVQVNLYAGPAAAADIHVTLSINNALITAYNTANGTTVQVMPTAGYTLPLSLTIPAGGVNVLVPISVGNTTGLNSNLSYAVALTITAVDGNLKIAENLKNLLIIFSVKNQYDGKYNMRGRFYHPANDPAFSPHLLFVELQTSGPNSVRLYWPLVGGYNTPLTVNGQPACCFAAQELSINVNPSTNAATAVNTAVGGTIVYDAISRYPPGTILTNRWDPAAKIFYLSFGYNLGPGGTFVLGTSRAWIDTFIRTGPR